MSTIEVPWSQLSEQALRGVVEEFITREGTDYGSRELSLEDKVCRLLRQIRSGDVLILFDSVRENCQLVARAEYVRHE